VELEEAEVVGAALEVGEVAEGVIEGASEGAAAAVGAFVVVEVEDSGVVDVVEAGFRNACHGQDQRLLLAKAIMAVIHCIFSMCGIPDAMHSYQQASCET